MRWILRSAVCSVADYQELEALIARTARPSEIVEGSQTARRNPAQLEPGRGGCPMKIATCHVWAIPPRS